MVLLVGLLFVGVETRGQTIPYPIIRDLSNDDPVFRQLQDDIAAFHIAEANGKELPPVAFYAYHPMAGDDLFALAARLNTGVQTVATANRIETPASFASDRHLVIPNVPGIFVPEEPANDLELMLTATYAALLSEAAEVVIYAPAAHRFRVLPGAEFTGIDTAFFLGILFRFPLPRGTVTSWFGERSDPFTGNLRFHNGIDIAAPMGTEVFAAMAGTVISAGTDSVLGLHVVIDHASGHRTVYGHLSARYVELLEPVKSGSLIGAVGSTGRSTGPHLHFEIRTPDGARDPTEFIHVPNANE